MKKELIIFFLVFSPLALKGQRANALFGLEVGISATHSYWENDKPDPNTYKLQNISHSSPFISLEYKKRFSSSLWIGLGVSACPVLYKISTYYWDNPYLRKRRKLRGYGEWQFPIIISYNISSNLLFMRHPGYWHLEGGFITTWKNPGIDFNNSIVQVNATTLRYEHGDHINFQVPIGLSYGVLLPNEKILKLKILFGIGTRMQFREFIEPENNLIVRSNASFLRLSLTYNFMINSKGASNPSDI